MQSCYESVEIVYPQILFLYGTPLLPVWKLTGFYVLPEIPDKQILHSRKRTTKRLNTFLRTLNG